MIGYDHESFWEQTPRTLDLTFAAHRERQLADQINEHNGRAWQAWHGAALGREKKMTPLRKLLRNLPAPPRAPASMDEQIEGLVNWVRATGGKVVYRDG